MSQRLKNPLALIDVDAIMCFSEASSGEAQQTKRLFEKQETHIDDDGAKEAESTNNTSRGGRRRRSKDYVAISLYYVDGPVSTVELKAKVKIIGN